jgi:perosamine synthetase
VVHIYGFPTDMNPVIEIAKKHNLKIIEDSAEMHGQTYFGKQCGSFGEVSTFSFYPNKHITTGEGGMIMTDDAEVAAKCRYYRNLCFKPEKRFVHDEIGWNYRMTNLQAALGVAQLENIDKHIIRKREIGKLYNQLLKDAPHIELMPVETEYAKNIYWVYCIVLKDSFKNNAEWMMKRLAEEKIGTRPFFYPMHMQPVFHKKGWYLNEKYSVSENIAERGFYLPSGLALTDSEIEIVSQTLIKILNE